MGNTVTVILFIAIVSLLFLPEVLRADVSILNLESHARQAAGNLLTSGDIDQLDRNPALLAQVSPESPIIFSAGFYRLPLESNVFQAAAFFPSFGFGNLGLAVSRLGIGEFTEYDEDAVVVGSISAGSWLTTAHWSNTLPWQMLAGVNVKYLYSSIDEYSAHAFASDLSIQRAFTVLDESIMLSFQIRNLGTPVQYDTGSENLPTRILGGLGYAGTWQSIGFETVAYAVYHDSRLGFQPGLELNYSLSGSELSLRSTYDSTLLTSPITFGLGINTDFKGYNTDISVLLKPSPIDGMLYLASVTFHENIQSHSEIRQLADDRSRVIRFREYLADNQLLTPELDIEMELKRATQLSRYDLALREGNWILLPVPLFLIYVPNEPEIKNFHLIKTDEGSIFRGLVRGFENRFILLDTIGGQLRIPVSSIVQIEDSYSHLSHNREL